MDGNTVNYLFEISGTKIKLIPNFREKKKCSLPQIKRSRTPKIKLLAIWPDVDELLTKEAEPLAWR